ncbi:VAN3-binding protein-like [Prunus yedoensis var. nudiflora]|uniref:VAN3-binding protein-like n=1 Tax=Prunus yedoensis var. nudiflora TaxID=2094558 RepID=A0A314UV28_PRUYE|nr:VAN3-binding protein-like [Prunus yedoensis var. nudiflora]
MESWSLGTVQSNAYRENKKRCHLLLAASLQRFRRAPSMPWSFYVAHGAHQPITFADVYIKCESLQILGTLHDLFGSHDNWTSGKQEDKFNSGEPDEKLEIQVIDELSSQPSTRSPMISRVDDTIWHVRTAESEKKDDIRLHTASVHAALSVTRLAAAIASVASNSKNSSIESEEDVVPIIGDIVASAAALVTTVCAEAAESLGAHKTHVSSAINSGLAIQTTDDMITLTAAAANIHTLTNSRQVAGLRGVAALKARAMGNAYFPRSQNLLQVKAELSVVTPSGSRTYGWACIYSKHSQLMLSLQKKHLGFLATRKELKLNALQTRFTRDGGNPGSSGSGKTFNQPKEQQWKYQALV